MVYGDVSDTENNFQGDENVNVKRVASKITDFLTEPDVLHLRTFVQMGK